MNSSSFNSNDTVKAPVVFRSVGIEPMRSILLGTPFQDPILWNQINSTQPFKIAHLSDALRLALIYRYRNIFLGIMIQ